MDGEIEVCADDWVEGSVVGSEYGGCVRGCEDGRRVVK